MPQFKQVNGDEKVQEGEIEEDAKDWLVLEEQKDEEYKPEIELKEKAELPFASL